MGDEDKKTYQVGFFVTVEVDAYEGEAAFVAGAACKWPIHRHHKPVEVSAPFNGGRITVNAKIVRAEALMVKEIFPECERCGYDHLTEDCPYPKE